MKTKLSDFFDPCSTLDSITPQFLALHFECHIEEIQTALDTLQQDWLNRYYPIEANKVLQGEAILRSLQKWKGLRNLKTYGLMHNGGREILNLRNDTVLKVDISSCSLCHHYYNKDQEEDRCIGCPLYVVRGGVSCDAISDDEEEVSPYFAFIDGGDPTPMINWLEKAKHDA